MFKENYYEVKAISNSTLGLINVSPNLFKRTLDGEVKQEDKDYLDMGTMIHACLLEIDVFNNMYVYCSHQIPKSPQAKLFTDIVISKANYSLNDAYFESYSTKNMSDEAIFKAASKLYEEHREYIQFMRENKGKLLISRSDYDVINKINYNVSNHKLARPLLQVTDKVDKFKVLTEEPGYFTYRGFKCKFKPDKVIINYATKTVILIDVKTTSKNVHQFIDAFKFYEINRQLAFYTLGLQLIHPLEGFEFVHYIIAVQTTGGNEVAVYRVPKSFIEDGKIKYDNYFDKVEKHNEVGFDYPLEYYEGDGSILLEDKTLILETNE